MTNKFWFLVKQSLLKKIKTKTFIIVNILMLIALVALINIDKIVLLFGGNFNKANNIMVVDNTKETYDTFKDIINNTSTIIDIGLNYKVKLVDNEKNIKKKIKKDEDIAIIINKDEENIISAKMITYGYIDSSLYQLVISSIDETKQKYLSYKKINL